MKSANRPTDLRGVRRRQRLDAFALSLRTSSRAFEEVCEGMIAAATDYLDAIERDAIGPEVGVYEADELLSREAAAKRLGIDPTTLTKIVESGHLTVTRLPGAKGDRDIVRFSAKSIDEFKRAHTINARAS